MGIRRGRRVKQRDTSKRKRIKKKKKEKESQGETGTGGLQRGFKR